MPPELRIRPVRGGSVVRERRVRSHPANHIGRVCSGIGFPTPIPTPAFGGIAHGKDFRAGSPLQTVYQFDKFAMMGHRINERDADDTIVHPDDFSVYQGKILHLDGDNRVHFD